MCCKNEGRECVNLARHFPFGFLAAVTFIKPLIQKVNTLFPRSTPAVGGRWIASGQRVSGLSSLLLM